jgi:hypothetical protein
LSETEGIIPPLQSNADIHYDIRALVEQVIEEVKSRQMTGRASLFACRLCCSSYLLFRA